MTDLAEIPDDLSVFSPERRRLTIGLVLTVTLVAFESLAVSTVMPEVEDDLGGLALYGWVFSAFFLGTLVGAVMAGQGADRRGTAPPFVLGLVLFAVGVGLAGAAPSMPVLVAARVLQGLGAGAIPAVAYTSVGRAYPPLLRPRVFAVFSSAWVVPGLIGPTLASGIEHALSWRFVFWAILPLVAVAAAMTLPALRGVDGPPADVPPDRRPDRIGRAVVLALGAAAVLAGTEAGELVVAVPLVAVGAAVAVRAFTGLVPPGTLRMAEGLPSAIAVRGILTFAFFGTDAFITLAATDARGQEPWVGGLALTAATIAWTIAAWVQQRQVHRHGPRALVTVGLAIVAVGIGGALLLAGSAPIPVAILVWGVAGFGTGLCYAPLSVTTLGLAAPGEEGQATSSLQLSDVLGVALGTGCTGAIVALGDGRGWEVGSSLTIAFTATAAVALLGALAARRLPAALPR